MFRHLLLLACGWTCVAASPKPQPPKLMLYAWLAPGPSAAELRDAGVAFDLADVMLDRDDVWVSPRGAELRLPAGTFAMPVLRLNFEPEGKRKPLWTARQRTQIGQIIAEAVELTQARSLQIDFDAPVSGRAFYRSVLEDARRRLGPDVFLSITALASWCDAGSWMKGLPVDEIVPLAFRLGQAEQSVQSRLSRGEGFGFAGCRASIGVESEGWRPPIARGQRVYVFPFYRGWGQLDALRTEIK